MAVLASLQDSLIGVLKFEKKLLDALNLKRRSDSVLILLSKK